MPRLKMHERPRALGKDINDRLADHQSANGLISSTQTFCNGLQVGNDTFLLPGVQGAGATHAGEDLVEDEKGAVFVTDGFHGFEIAWERRNAAECLLLLVSIAVED